MLLLLNIIYISIFIIIIHLLYTCHIYHLVYTHSVIFVIQAIRLVRYLGLFNNIHLLRSG